MRCTHCGTDIAAKALICFKCGKATTAPRIKPPAQTSLFEKPKARWWPVAVGAAVAAAALAAWLLMA